MFQKSIPTCSFKNPFVAVNASRYIHATGNIEYDIDTRKPVGHFIHTEFADAFSDDNGTRWQCCSAYDMIMNLHTVDIQGI